jgi:hypothetical protein
MRITAGGNHEHRSANLAGQSSLDVPATNIQQWQTDRFDDVHHQD